MSISKILFADEMYKLAMNVDANDQLNMALILLSKVWSSRLSILMAWKYYLGSK
jgi:steroid 5-alpha reductase family enzyme